MKRWMRSAILLPLLALGLQGCGPKYKDQPSCGFVQNVYGERISWKGDVPVDLYVHQSFPPSMIVALENAIQDWQNKAGRPLFRIAGTGLSGPIAPRQDGSSIIYWMSDWESDKASEQARTSVYWIGAAINEADIRINAKDFTYYVDPSLASYHSVHLESLLVHELGHVLGLKHKDDGDSVMATYLASQTERTNISDGDEEDLKCEY